MQLSLKIRIYEDTKEKGGRMWIPNDPASIDHIVIAERPNTSMYINIFKQNLIYQNEIYSFDD